MRTFINDHKAITPPSRRGQVNFSPMLRPNTLTYIYLVEKTVVKFDWLLINNNQSNSTLLLCDVTSLTSYDVTD